MAAEAVDDPEWRARESFRQFINLKCLKSGHEELDIDADDFDITLLDVRKMKTHILDCVAALGIVQQELVYQEQELVLQEGDQSLTEEAQAVLLSNKVFKASLSIMATAMLHDSIEVPKQSNSIVRLLAAFPDDSKMIDGRSWLPLHWAVVADEKISEADVNMIYISDPMALQRYHSGCLDIYGYTPAHLLCMQEVTQRNMSLIRHLSICNSGAFTMSASFWMRINPLSYSYSALHAACGLGQPTEDLLKHLLQLDISQMKKKCPKKDLTPLSHLFENSNCSDRLVSCLLEVDSSAEVIGSVIHGCLKSTDCSRMLERVEILLKANPEAAKYHDASMNLLKLAVYEGKLPSQLCIDIIQRILTIHKDAVREVDEDGWLPVHYAAEFSTVEVMEFLLGLYPESASVVTSDNSSLLHLAVIDTQNTTSVMEEKVRFLCSRYPAMIHQGDGGGTLPLHGAICTQNFSAAPILCEAGGQEQVRVPISHLTDASYLYNGWLSLHFLINRQAVLRRDDSLFSKAADCFRMLLRWYPEAAGIEGGNGLPFKKTPYQLAVDRNLPSYYLRLLLRAAPDLNPAELRRLNYAERRMAMFLAFKAVTSRLKPLLLKRLCFENKDLVKHVVSFL